LFVVCVSGVCVRVWCPSSHCVVAFRSVLEVWLCLYSHMKQTAWDATDTLS
jgi:hypothetical protein